ncbi:NAD(P)-dependent oxidoreductase [Vibrio sp. T187]|uniref:NAD-dependent epimerase/dehydratase family protein n=1 Tax=Vibrio TaxID=662 RepID=UPI0010C9C556|nr:MULTISPECIES: NAD(P)-dependent oxidoreductase [Vibrio]MBW3696038.1 NAD(P)-dependent oxidoreductase [Vibrio sp. T187]
MKILVTGSAGRVGRAIYIKLMRTHQVVGLDTTPCSTVDIVGDIRDKETVNKALDGVKVVVHTAALHAPHVGIASEEDFQSINVDATKQLALQGLQNGIEHFVFTSTTALYGHASTPKGTAGWIDEKTTPQPKSIYHRSKIAAENGLKEISDLFNLPVTVLQMSRCFPEPVDLMAIYRLNRGVDARDVASAHLCALDKRLNGFHRFIISGKTPFDASHCQRLFTSANSLVKELQPQVAVAFEERGWGLPKTLDRVYDSSAAQQYLDWQPKYGFESVLEMYDQELAEVLPTIKRCP